MLPVPQLPLPPSPQSLLERFPGCPQHPASVSPHDSPIFSVQLQDLLRPWVLRCCGTSQHPKQQRPPWCPIGDGWGAPAPLTTTPSHPPAAPAHLGSPVRPCGTRPRTRTCTPSPRRAGSAPWPRTSACCRGTGSPRDSQHCLQAKEGVGGGEKDLGDTGSGEQPFPLISDVGITAAPQHPHPTQGPVAPSVTPAAVPPPSQKCYGSSCSGKKPKTTKPLFWLFLGKASTCSFGSGWETAASPGEGWHPGVGTPVWVLELTRCQADASGQGVAQDVFLAVVEGEGTCHAQPLPGGQAGVRAAGEGDVLAQAVGQGLVGGPRRQDVIPLSGGCHGCRMVRKFPPPGMGEKRLQRRCLSDVGNRGGVREIEPRGAENGLLPELE